MAPRLGQLVRRVVTVQAAVAVLLVAVSVTLFVVAQRYEDRADATRETLIDLGQLRGDVLSAETSLRGFVLTARPAFLEPYRESGPRVDRLGARIAGRVDAADEASARALAPRFARWRATFAEPILVDLAAGRADDAQAIVLSGRGKMQIDAIRDEVRRLVVAERAALGRDQDRADRVGLAGIGFVGVLSVLALTTAVLFRRRLDRDVVVPMQELASATERFGAGDHDVRAPVDGVHEVRVTAATFNAMAEELARTVDDLRGLDELKSRFVSMVSHELRTPLTSILGFAEELDEDEAGLSADGREAVEVIVRNAGHLEAIIDDLLLLSSLESGRVELRLEEVPLDALLREIGHELAPVARRSSVSIAVEAADDVVVHADRGRMRQACANLVSNAVKFSPAGGTVRIAASVAGDDVRVEVADEGPGIPADELPRLTERFFRASTSAGTSGTGLGLTITSELVQRHGGRLEVESVAGEGATFRIVVPRRPAVVD